MDLTAMYFFVSFRLYCCVHNTFILQQPNLIRLHRIITVRLILNGF